MEIVLLGTGGPIPDPDRAGPATLIRAGETPLLFDAGRGVLMRAAAADTGPTAFSAVLLTHLHSDHITDLNDLITTRWVMTFAPDPLPIFGPPGTQEVVDGILAMLRSDVGYRIGHHEDLTWEPPVEVTEVTDGIVWEAAGVSVTAAPTDHRPVAPTVGYRVDHEESSVVIAGDTVPCAGLDRLCDGADALVHTVIRKDILEALPMQRLKDVCDYHSSVEEAAQTATRGGVGTLVLTHCVPAFESGGGDEWRDRAAAHFDGRIELGDDLHTVSV